jgi:hypothetical protein
MLNKGGKILLDKLERKFGKFAIKNLMYYIIFLTGFVFILMLFDSNGNYTNRLILYPDLVRQGQIWRLFTYIFIPPTGSLFFIVFVLYLYYLIGSALEQEWGSFKFNMYYLIGMLGTTIAALITGFGTSTYLNLSLFLAFARLFPDYQILMFFFIPAKVKYLGWINWAFIVFTIVTGSFSEKAAAVASVLNFLIFFGKDIITGKKNVRKVQVNRRTYQNSASQKPYMHKCSVCGVTEIDNNNAEFRYCSKCEGYYEYCMDHLHNHSHKEK